MSDFKFIDYNLVNDVAYIRFNQPDTLNAMSTEMGHETLDALDLGVKQARVIVLAAHGRAFCSGAKLSGKGGVDLDDPQRDMGFKLETIFNPMLLKIRDLPIPLITSVKGAAAGIGCSLALISDIIIAGKSAFFLQAFCNVGLVPDGGSAYLLTRAIGRVRANELMLLGERYPAQRAYDDGLITRLVEDNALEATTRDIAEKLARGPSHSLKLIRQSTWTALDSTFEQQLARERDQQREAGRTDDFLEGVAAFREKRKALFQG